MVSLVGKYVFSKPEGKRTLRGGKICVARGALADFSNPPQSTEAERRQGVQTTEKVEVISAVIESSIRFNLSLSFDTV